MAATTTHPLDLTKVRMQTTPEGPSGQKPGMFRTLQHTVHTSGFRGIYQGLSASLLRQMSYSLVRIGSYESIKRYLTQGKEKKSPTRLILSAAIAGGLGGIAGNPADILLVRMTSDSLRDPKDQYRYKHAFDGLIRLVREEGIMALGRGLSANTTRAILMNASQLVTYDTTKAAMQRRYGMKDGLPLHIISSTTSGIIATTVCSPADVIKSRVMHSSEAVSVLDVVKTSLRQEGVAFLFKGWTPAFVRLAPNTILMFVFMEQLKKLWANKHPLLF
ncbi:mitochondrial carrier [Clavulina sp. PMI_390]|nr:mitochondrial carrier [Clavulina sp. PMI_390]